MAVTSRQQVHVLYVDDEPDFTELTATFLDHENDKSTVKTATSADQELQIIGDRPPDRIVSDYNMPQIDGLEFLETVRTEYPIIPLILYTGNDSEEVASEAISAELTNYLQKGIGSKQYELLANRIRNACEQVRALCLAAEQKHISTAVREINGVLVQATNREEIGIRIYEILTDSESYVLAWIGMVAGTAERIKSQTAAVAAEEYLADIIITTDNSPTGQGSGGTTIRENRVAEAQDIIEDGQFELWRETTLERGYQSVASIPLTHEDTRYGLLSVYAERDRLQTYIN